MKKLLGIIALVGLLVAPLTPRVYCAEIDEPAFAESEEGFVEEAREWLGQYFESTQVANIINWAIDTGVLAALFAVVVKYRKYKALTTEDLLKHFKKEIKDYLEECFDELTQKHGKDIVERLEQLEEANETLMKVLVLAQDKTSQGRIALIDYLGSKTDTVKDIGEEVKSTIEEQELQDQIAISKFDKTF